MINVELLRKNLEYVTAHRDQWDQSYWVQRTWCGTTACLAGTVVLNAGCRPYVSKSTQRNVSFVRDAAGELHGVSDLAQRLLGLTGYQANVLFYGENSLGTLWRYASEITDGAIEVPIDVEDVPSAAELEDELIGAFVTR